MRFSSPVILFASVVAGLSHMVTVSAIPCPGSSTGFGPPTSSASTRSLKRWSPDAGNLPGWTCRWNKRADQNKKPDLDTFKSSLAELGQKYNIWDTSEEYDKLYAKVGRWLSLPEAASPRERLMWDVVEYGRLSGLAKSTKD
ncbi:hypothetical protein BC835DRAFT_1391706, partial [Cytidiella melzeri]